MIAFRIRSEFEREFILKHLMAWWLQFCLTVVEKGILKRVKYLNLTLIIPIHEKRKIRSLLVLERFMHKIMAWPLPASLYVDGAAAHISLYHLVYHQ